jgi:transcription elongation factor GreA
MSDKPTYLTRDGRAQLEAELEQLTTVERRLVAKRIEEAKELGDISESGEYEDAKKAQALLEGRIRDIKNILSRAEMIDEDSVTNGEVRVGSSVTVRFDGEDDEETWTIVGSAEANPIHGRISNESPIGSALLGKRQRQKVTVQTPNGVSKLTIVKVQQEKSQKPGILPGFWLFSCVYFPHAFTLLCYTTPI